MSSLNRRSVSIALTLLLLTLVSACDPVGRALIALGSADDGVVVYVGSCRRDVTSVQLVESDDARLLSYDQTSAAAVWQIDADKPVNLESLTVGGEPPDGFYEVKALPVGEPPAGLTVIVYFGDARGRADKITVVDPPADPDHVLDSRGDEVDLETFLRCD
jgi:hypothetical protein